MDQAMGHSEYVTGQRLPAVDRIVLSFDRRQSDWKVTLECVESAEHARNVQSV